MRNARIILFFVVILLLAVVIYSESQGTFCYSNHAWGTGQGALDRTAWNTCGGVTLVLSNLLGQQISPVVVYILLGFLLILIWKPGYWNLNRNEEV